MFECQYCYCLRVDVSEKTEVKSDLFLFILSWAAGSSYLRAFRVCVHFHIKLLHCFYDPKPISDVCFVVDEFRKKKSKLVNSKKERNQRFFTMNIFSYVSEGDRK